jgi:hypothetical protein
MQPQSAAVPPHRDHPFPAPIPFPPVTIPVAFVDYVCRTAGSCKSARRRKASLADPEGFADNARPLNCGEWAIGDVRCGLGIPQYSESLG